jgi:hypothetical protein
VRATWQTWREAFDCTEAVMEAVVEACTGKATP